MHFSLESFLQSLFLFETIFQLALRLLFKFIVCCLEFQNPIRVLTQVLESILPALQFTQESLNTLNFNNLHNLSESGFSELNIFSQTYKLVDNLLLPFRREMLQQFLPSRIVGLLQEVNDTIFQDILLLIALYRFLSLDQKFILQFIELDSEVLVLLW